MFIEFIYVDPYIVKNLMPYGLLSANLTLQTYLYMTFQVVGLSLEEVITKRVIF